MDTTTQLTHISLCAGYGGIDLGLKRVIPDLRTIAISEIEAFACANLVAKMEAGLMDAAPIWTDLKTFPYAEFSDRVDILSGGYPCQPFSAAGKRLGKDDPRHLWPYIADGIRLLRPKLCFFENVEGHISLGLREVVGELESMGYAVSWGIFSAREVGAPHQRKRVFILAYRDGAGLEVLLSELAHSQRWQESIRSITGSDQCSRDGQLADPPCDGSGEGGVVQQGTDGPKSFSNGTAWGTWPARPGHDQFSWEPPRVVGNAEEQGCGRLDDEQGEIGVREARGYPYRASDPEQQEQWQTQPSLGGDVDGSSSGLDYAQLCVSNDNRTDELRLLGNGVVPAVAALAFRTLMNQLKNT